MTRTHNKVQYPPKSKLVRKASAIEEEAVCSPEAAAKAFRILEGRWKLDILRELFGAGVQASLVRRFSELERGIPAVSQKMLIQQLRELERDGIVHRTVYPEVPPRVEYKLTKRGEALRPALRALTAWAMQDEP